MLPAPRRAVAALAAAALVLAASPVPRADANPTWLPTVPLFAGDTSYDVATAMGGDGTVVVAQVDATSPGSVVAQVRPPEVRSDPSPSCRPPTTP